MKILALYTNNSLSIQRRIKSPFSILANRGHDFSFMQVESFNAGLAYGADVTVLNNWIFTDEELALYKKVCLDRRFIYDCSDPTLLDNAIVREQIQRAHLVTVPNEFLKKEVAGLNRNVAITPSCIDPDYFYEARRHQKELGEKKGIAIGCFGPYDWYLLKDVLPVIKQRYPSVTFVGGHEAGRLFLPDILSSVNLSVEYYPLILEACDFGLCPSAGNHGRDAIWSMEYGILCKPVIELDNPGVAQPESWVMAISLFMKKPEILARRGMAAFREANEQRANQRANEHLQIYRKKLPHLASL